VWDGTYEITTATNDDDNTTTTRRLPARIQESLDCQTKRTVATNETTSPDESLPRCTHVLKNLMNPLLISIRTVRLYIAATAFTITRITVNHAVVLLRRTFSDIVVYWIERRLDTGDLTYAIIARLARRCVTWALVMEDRRFFSASPYPIPGWASLLVRRIACLWCCDVQP